MPQFSIMTDEDLIRFAETTLDPLTTTGLELALVDRLRLAVDEVSENAPLIDMLADRGFDGSDTKTLEADLELLERLKTVLDEHDLPEDDDVLCSELESLATVREALTATA